MVDIHCHILPEVDDGAQSLDEALEMARIAVNCGVTDLVATSHFRGDEEGTARIGQLHRQFRRLEKALRQENIPLRLYRGAEILCTPEVLDLARDRVMPTLGDTDYVLCEFPFRADYGYMDEVLDAISEAGYRPVIAHPERYAAIQRNPRRVKHWFYMGYVVQVNKGSVMGAFGAWAQDAAQWLLGAGLVHLIASDAHSPCRRTPDLSPVRAWLLDHCSRDYVRLLLEENPGRLLRGEDMAPVDGF